MQTTQRNLSNKPKTEMSTKLIEAHLKEILRREYQHRQPGMIKIIEDWLERGRTPEDIGRIAREAGATPHVENVMVLIAEKMKAETCS